jgi:hypothetical protein
MACNLPGYHLDRDQEEWALPLLTGEIKAITLLENSVTLGEIRVAPTGPWPSIIPGRSCRKPKRYSCPYPATCLPMTDTLNESLPVVNNMIIRKAILGKAIIRLPTGISNGTGEPELGSGNAFIRTGIRHEPKSLMRGFQYFGHIGSPFPGGHPP